MGDINHIASIKVHVFPILWQIAIVQVVFKTLGEIYQKCKPLDIINHIGIDIADRSSKRLSLLS
ncbi:MAG TPA: hypothetical protein VIE89_24220 [Candidatus Binatia bacterium]